MSAAVFAPSPPAATARRLWEIDALRGLMLVLMTVTHVPTRLSDPLGQPFGFVSAAEGFVLLSGFMAGMVYAQRQLSSGDAAMRDAFLKRALKLYAVQAALLLFVLSVIALIGVLANQSAITDLVSFFLERPLAALVSGLLLLYNPPLLDILPMYVVFMAASPMLLTFAGRHGWRGILAASGALWLGAQFGLGTWLYEAFVRPMRMPVPLHETGAFEVLAWQFIWVLGLWMGAQQAAGRPVQPTPFPRAAVVAAVSFALVHGVWRHAVGQAPFGADEQLNMLYDKWSVGPLRLLDFFSLIVVAMHFGPRLAERLPRLKVLELLGRQSLPVFCAHVVLAMLVLASLGAVDRQRPWAMDLALLGACFGVLYLVAQASEQIDRRTAAARQRLKERRAVRRSSSAAPQTPGALKSPDATAHSPPG